MLIAIDASLLLGPLSGPTLGICVHVEGEKVDTHIHLDLSISFYLSNVIYLS